MLEEFSQKEGGHMGRKGRRIRKLHDKHKYNKHHLLWPRHDWSTGYAYLLRNAFVRTVPIQVHNELHQKCLTSIPVPSERLLEIVWAEYLLDKTEIDNYDTRKAIAWLYDHVNNADFRKAMQTQFDFFATRLD